MSYPERWEAKFDGKAYPMKNDPAGTMVSLKRVDAYTIDEIDRQGGKIVAGPIGK
jgi:hypothetical protein